MRDNFNLNLKEAADRMTGGFSLKLPPGVWRREVVHIARFIVRFVPQVECQLVPQTYFFLVRVRQQQDLCDGGWRHDGIEGWELGARGRLQLYFHHLWYSCLKADVGDRNGGRGQHGDDHHQHVGPRWRTVTGKGEQNPETVFVEYGHR